MMIRDFLMKMLIAALILVFLSLKFVDVTVGENIAEYPLETGWKAIGLPIKQVETQTWMGLNQEWYGVTELKAMAEKIIWKLGLKLQTNLNTGTQDNFSFVSFEGRQSDGTIVAVTLQSSDNNGCYETQLGINTIYDLARIPNLPSYLKKLTRGINSLGSKGSTHILLEGEYVGKLSKATIRELSGKTFQKLQANLVATAFESGTSTHKGYSRLIKETAEYEMKTVNVELCTRYDAARNVTEILLATPTLADGI